MDIHLKGTILKLLVRSSESDDPELAAALSNLLLVRIKTFSMDENHAAQLKPSITKFEDRLNKSNWENIVRVKDLDDQVNIFIKCDDKNRMVGLVLIALAKNGDAVFVNFVGDLNWQSAKKFGHKFGIKELICLDDYGLNRQSVNRK